MDKRKPNHNGRYDRFAGMALLVIVLGCGYGLQFVEGAAAVPVVSASHATR